MEKAPSLDEVRAPDEDVCFVIASNANCDSEGTSLTMLTCSSLRAGPIHRSMRSGVTVHKCVAVSFARARLAVSGWCQMKMQHRRT